MKSLIRFALGGLVMTTIALPLDVQEPTGEWARQRTVMPWGISSSPVRSGITKMWGYDFVISPRLSVPFAIGKIEVSTVPIE